MRALFAVVFTSLLALITSGCTQSDKPPTYKVTGTVTYDGKPVESGSIVFDPADGMGQSAMGGIENGKITADVPAGEMIVRISAVRTSEKKDQYGEAITESYIPDKYNQASQIYETVKPDGDNTFTIALEK
ncbi:hypothetical protein GC197_15915 [bacterium]|nr:hypothetical protein [bacterium]